MIRQDTPNPTQLWLVDLERASPALLALEAGRASLAPGDIARLHAIVDAPRQRQRRSATIALRLVLEGFFGASLRGIDLPRDEFGRPHLPTPFIGSFSSAHTSSHALIAASRLSPIGVDLEGPRQLVMPDARRLILQRAAATLNRQPLPVEPTACFLQTWVRLEALAKADGRGIGHLLTRIGAIGQARRALTQTQLGSASALADSHHLVVHDLAMPERLHAAIACQAALPPAVHQLPEALPEILDALNLQRQPD